MEFLDIQILISKEKLLGVILDDKLKFDSHIH